jgi:hypothetical protein
MWGVVDQYHLLQRTPDYAKVLHEELVGHKRAALTVKTVLDDARGVDVVQDRIRVAFVTCREYNYVEVFAQFFYQLFCIWPYVYKAAAYFSLERLKGYFNLVPGGHDLTRMY